MSQKASKYVSIGLKASKHALRQKNESTLKYKVFSLASLLGKRFFVSYPLFALADYRLAGQIEDAEAMDMDKAFEDSGDTEKYVSVAQLALLSQVILLTGLAIIGGVAYGFIHLGARIDQLLEFERYYMVFAFQILSGCVFIGFLIKKAMYFGPVAYLIQSGEAGSLSEALSHGASFMTPSGKAKLTYLHVYHLGRVLVYAITAFLVAYAALATLPAFLFIAITIGVGILFLRSLPRVMLSHKLSTMRLFSDQSKEMAYESLLERETSSGSNGKISKEETLIGLFDELSNDNIKSDSDKKSLVNERG
ncbi:MAG: hypothetical protein ACOCSM_00585 [Bacillota bacterium]